MGSRKESLKKSLGISEYPWSSDDEETPSQPTPEIPLLRRQSGETRTSAADMPSTSGVQQQAPDSPTTARRQQNKMDRALFWSIINNTPRPNVNVSRVPRPDLPVTYVSRPAVHARSDGRRVDRSSTSQDIQRIIAFKKLTRSLHNLAHPKPNTNVFQTSSARPGTGSSSGSASRSPLFTPSVSTEGLRPRSRFQISFQRSQPERTLNRDEFIRRLTQKSPSDVDPQPSTSSQYRSLPPRPTVTSDLDTSPPVPEHEYVNIDHSDDEVEAAPETVPVVEERESRQENNVEEENPAGTSHNASAGAISLEEEIVEVDAPDEPDNVPRSSEETHMDVENNNVEPQANAERDTKVIRIGIAFDPQANAVATTSDEGHQTPPIPQSPYQGVKRKRDSNTSEENGGEPYSVQEFNQSLLRLLECPVCLEWMEPPISQCRRGHLVCSRCRTRLASCPVCRTTFSSVRNRAMEGVAEMLRYPCRHGCGREVRLRRRGPHEASCGARRYHCPAPPCARVPPLPHHDLAHHFQSKHLQILKIGKKHKFSMKVNSEQHDTWLIMALDEFFHLRVDVDIRTWGVIVYVAYIGPKRKAKHFTYEVTVEGQHNSRSLKYSRSTHSDLESSSLNVSRQDCFHLTLDQALNFLRFKNRHCEPDKFLDFDVEISKCQSSSFSESKDESDS